MQELQLVVEIKVVTTVYGSDSNEVLVVDELLNQNPAHCAFFACPFRDSVRERIHAHERAPLAGGVWESQDPGRTYPYSRLTYGQKAPLVHTPAYLDFLRRHSRLENLRGRGNFGRWFARHYDLSN